MGITRLIMSERGRGAIGVSQSKGEGEGDDLKILTKGRSEGR